MTHWEKIVSEGPAALVAEMVNEDGWTRACHICARHQTGDCDDDCPRGIAEYLNQEAGE